MEPVSKASVKSILRALIISAPDRFYETQQLQRDYKSEEGDYIPYCSFGFKTLKEFLSSFEDFSVFETGGKQYVRCSEIKESRHINRLVNEQKRTKPTRPKRESRDITSNPFPFPIQDYSKQLINSNNFDVKTQMNYKNNEIEHHSRYLKRGYQAIPDYALQENIDKLDTDFDWVGHLPQYKLGRGIKVGSIIKILVTEVYTPSEIWFHILDDDYGQKLSALLEEMNQYYHSSFYERQMPVSSQRNKGRACVVRYAGEFHRATIAGYVRCRENRVLLSDYGTIVDVNVKNVAFLADEFALLPAQAVQGKLACVRPTFDDDWTDFVNQHLGAKIFDRVVHAKVTHIEEDTNTLQLILLKEVNGEFVNVNKQLIQMGYARASD